jgi:16S rRNA (guanine527-N7)-methyltransferase
VTFISDGQIEAALKPYGIAASSELASMIPTYISLLLKWNRTISLTTVTDVDEILRFHFGESLFALTQLSIEKGRLADVGSGAGFPGIPLAMVAQAVKVTLIESNARKFAFLNEIIRELRLKNVVALRCRMEEVNRPDQRFNFVTARALGQFGELLKWSRKQLNPAGKLVLWLGEGDVREISDVPEWSWSPQIAIPGSERRFILLGTPKI